MDGFNCIEDNAGRGICVFYKKDIELSVHHKIFRISQTYKIDNYHSISHKETSKLKLRDKKLVLIIFTRLTLYIKAS